MKTLVIVEKQINNCYVLIDAENNKYDLVIEFYNFQKPEVNDKILIHESLLDKNSENFCTPYAFEKDNGRTAKEVSNSNNAEFIVIRKNNRNFVLKRIYG